jgi:hypothetical protein
VLPKEDSRLKQLIAQRDSYYVEKNMLLPYEVEWGLSRVFEQEILNYQIINNVTRELTSYPGFNTLDAFREIDTEFLGFLNRNK